MQKLKPIIPELLLMAMTIYYWTLAALAINWLAIAILAILLYLIMTQNRVLGIVLPTLLIIINLYLILALLSEFHEFSEFNNDTKKLVLGGSLFIGFNIFISSTMLLKYARKTSKIIETNNA